MGLDVDGRTLAAMNVLAASVINAYPKMRNVPTARKTIVHLIPCVFRDVIILRIRIS